MESFLELGKSKTSAFIYSSPVVSFRHLAKSLQSVFPNSVAISVNYTEEPGFVPFSFVTQKRIDEWTNKGRVIVIEAFKHYQQFSNNNGQFIAVISKIASYEAILKTAEFMAGRGLSTFELARYMRDRSYYLSAAGTSFLVDNMEYKLPMSQAQYDEYLKTKDDWTKQRVLNFVYPAEVSSTQRDYLRSEKQYGWITPSYLETLKEMSIKLYQLLDFAKMNPGKHVVYTQLDDVAGVKVIHSFLKLANFNSIKITQEDSIQRKRQKLQRFNSLDRAVLVTNVPSIDTLRDVTTLVVFDQPEHDHTINHFMRQIASSGSREIAVVFFVAVGPNEEETLESRRYEKLMAQIGRRNFLFECLKDGSNLKLERAKLYLNQDNLTSSDLKAVFDGNAFKILTLDSSGNFK